jgi:hypothetical protein
MSPKHRIVIFLLMAFVLPAVLRAEESKSWTDRIKLSGDFRYRYEFIGSQTYVPFYQDSLRTANGFKARVFDRNRNRLRLRLGIQAMVNPDMDLYVRIASSTGSTTDPGVLVAGDPVSTNQDLTGSFVPKPIWIDRAYVDYHPACAKWMVARAGKQPVPYETTDLVWDSDINLEGVAALFSHKFEGQELFLRVGGFWANETGPTSSVTPTGALALKHAVDQGLFSGQIGGKVSADRLTAQLAAAYLTYGNVKNNLVLYSPNSGGNTLVSGKYVHDYHMINVNGMVKVKTDQIEPSLVADFILNTAAKKDTTTERNSSGTRVPAYDKKLNIGYLAGLGVKFFKLPIDWDMGYNIRYLQKDATIAAYTDSDPIGGGTNFAGHKFTLGFNVLPGARLAFAYIKDIRDVDNKLSERRLDYDRVQADIEVKF